MKKNNIRDCDFYLVTDSYLSRRGTLSDVKQAVSAGCRIVQYREKQKSTREMIKEAEQIKSICGDSAIFIVNDRVDVALAVDADGVHIGQEDMPFGMARRLMGREKIIGLTVHNVDEAVEAERAGADYIGVSPVFETGTKKDAGGACGLSMITMVRKRARLPIVAIGGITMENVREVVRVAADIIAVISAVVCADNVYKETAYFIRLIQSEKQMISDKR